MKKSLFAFLLVLIGTMAFSQYSQELMEALNSVPIVETYYPANRDRTIDIPTWNQAYQYAFYNLPYALDLKTYQNYAGTTSEEVLIDFSSVDLKASTEISILNKAIQELNNLLATQRQKAIIAENRTNQAQYGSSQTVAISAQGDAIVAYREMESTTGLINKLKDRRIYLSDSTIEK